MRRPTFANRAALTGILCAGLLAACADSPPENPGGASSTTTTTVPTTSTISTSTGAGGSTASGGAGGVATTSSSTASGGAGGEAPCTATLVGGPGPQSYPFTLAGQTAWSHDEGFPAGYFHTYDALDVGGPGDAPHKVHVFLPRGYGPCDPGYPVIYMNDGGTAFWPAGPGSKTWDVAHVLGDLWAVSAVPQVLVVAIEPNDRNFEYSHTPGQPNAACCGADAYTAYVADRIKPFIDANYRTRSDRGDTMIIGSSRGGLASFYMATRRPDIFGKAVCMSSSFWFGLDPVFGGTYPGGPLSTSLLVAPVTATLADPSRRPRFWIDWGLVRTGGTHNDTIEAAATTRGQEMVGLLQGTYGYTVGSDLGWEEDPIGEHDEISWGRRLPHALEALF